MTNKIQETGQSVVAGFTIAEEGGIPRLNAKTRLLLHEKSGAQILCILNDDKELGFSISYRTPCSDETDVNHALEHILLTSSGKYPGKDIFFELSNKSCSTFVNAYTYPVMTSYPVCSQSEAQLRIMADVYLSCLTDPEALRDPNIFKREALRYELKDADSPICLAGTVYGEDSGYLTDPETEALNNMLHSLYPGLTAANGIGRAHFNYEKLTWDYAKEIYSKYYTFDNSLIILYGNMNYDEMLSFLDREYLGKARRGSEQSLPAAEEPVPEGFVELTAECPAYLGDAEDSVSILEYGIDISGYPLADQLFLELLADLLDHQNSPFHKRLKQEGIFNRAYCGLSGENAKNFLALGIENADEGQKEGFLKAVKKALEDVVCEGIDEEIIQGLIKHTELSDCLARENTQLAVETSSDIGIYWALTGQTDYYQQQDIALNKLKSEKDQAWIKEMAQHLCCPHRSALVITVPKPGLAEQLEEELAAELARKKAEMTEEERCRLIEETVRFEQWNETCDSPGRHRLSIRPVELPQPAAASTVRKKKIGNISFYTAPVDNEKAGGFRLLFHTGHIAPEKLHYLSLYTFLLMELPTDKHTAEQLKILELKYLNRLSFDFAYPGEGAGEHHHAMLSVSWYAMTEDYPAALELLLEIMAETRFDNREEIARIIEKYMADYDLSRSGELIDTAMELANGYSDFWQRYGTYMEGQEFYIFLRSLLSAIKEGSCRADRAVEALTQIRGELLNQKDLCVMTAASTDSLPALEKTAVEKLKGQGVIPCLGGEQYDCIKRPAKRTAICAETPDQHCALVAAAEPGKIFYGRYLPFLMAAEDKYLIPRLRFEGGAYDAGASFRISMKSICLYTSGDPNVRYTLKTFAGICDFIRGMELSQEELDDYIVNAYSDATRPQGQLSRAMVTMNRSVENIDAEELRAITRDILEARAEDRERAADWLEHLLRQGCTVMMGNEKRLKQDRDCFDEILDFRNGGKGFASETL